MASFQISIGRHLKANGFHVEWDPTTYRRLPSGVKNPRGVKIATDPRDGRIGVVDCGSDPGLALEFVKSLGYELHRHEDGFIEVAPSEPEWYPWPASGPSTTFSEDAWRGLSNGSTAPTPPEPGSGGSSTDRGGTDGAVGVGSELADPDDAGLGGDGAVGVGSELADSAESLQASSRYQRGLDLMREVYAGDVTAPPEGVMDFADVMVPSLFAEVWGRDVMSIRDRRLLVLASAVCAPSPDTWKSHARAALNREELSPAELRETLIVLAQYCGYPKVVDLIPACEELIASWESEKGR